ncbi:ABC-three component system protein [Chelatococcus sp. GCM10030263]|uniref:ABC-three component system protein n=1 Tax=Chelatococcus sp. GCM10030263 TaxID=3273387 RepID=UPI00360F49D7
MDEVFGFHGVDGEKAGHAARPSCWQAFEPRLPTGRTPLRSRATSARRLSQSDQELRFFVQSGPEHSSSRNSSRGPTLRVWRNTQSAVSPEPHARQGGAAIGSAAETRHCWLENRTRLGRFTMMMLPNGSDKPNSARNGRRPRLCFGEGGLPKGVLVASRTALPCGDLGAGGCDEFILYSFRLSLENGRHLSHNPRTFGGRSQVLSEGITEIFADGAFASPASSALDIFFVHGLGGDPIETWQTGPKSFWPRWLAAKFPNCRVFSFGFDSKKLAGFLTGAGASLHDLALMLADALLSREHAAPHALFICHSLGGLIVKQMLRRCAESADPDYKDLARSVVGVAFLGTPHQGASLASALDQLLHRFMTKQVKQLVHGEDFLVDLNDYFRSNANLQSITVRSYYETEKTNGVHIVDKVTANPGVLGSEPIPVQSDHIQICKPESEMSPVFKSVCALIRKLLKDNSSPSSAGVAGSPYGSSQTDGHALLCESLPADAPEGLSADVLQDYKFFTTVAEDDRRDLAQKLTDVGRGYAIRDANRKKERFNMALRRHIAQPAAVTRYTRLMSEVESRFNRHVTRAIAAGACDAMIDGIIQNDVISPCAALNSLKDEPTTAGLVDGALYYLAGNCHLAWDHG